MPNSCRRAVSWANRKGEGKIRVETVAAKRAKVAEAKDATSSKRQNQQRLQANALPTNDAEKKGLRDKTQRA